MLCSVVYTEAHPRRSAAFASRMNLRDAAHSAPSGSNGTPFISFNFIPLRTLFLATDGYTPLPLADCRTRVTYSFRINTCKSVSKQKTLTPFRMNTYEKQGEGGGSGTRNLPNPARSAGVVDRSYRARRGGGGGTEALTCTDSGSETLVGHGGGRPAVPGGETFSYKAEDCPAILINQFQPGHGTH